MNSIFFDGRKEIGKAGGANMGLVVCLFFVGMIRDFEENTGSWRRFPCSKHSSRIKFRLIFIQGVRLFKLRLGYVSAQMSGRDFFKLQN